MGSKITKLRIPKEGIYQYLSVPYASKPALNNAARPLVPPKKFNVSNALRALHHSPECSPQQQDCLYLDLWRLNIKKLYPLLVVVGPLALPPIDLVTRGDIVVASVRVRPDALGAKDLQLAIAWLRDNANSLSISTESLGIIGVQSSCSIVWNAAIGIRDLTAIWMLSGLPPLDNGFISQKVSLFVGGTSGHVAPGLVDSIGYTMDILNEDIPSNLCSEPPLSNTQCLLVQHEYRPMDNEDPLQQLTWALTDKKWMVPFINTTRLLSKNRRVYAYMLDHKSSPKLTPPGAELSLIMGNAFHNESSSIHERRLSEFWINITREVLHERTHRQNRIKSWSGGISWIPTKAGKFQLMVFENNRLPRMTSLYRQKSIEFWQHIIPRFKEVDTPPPNNKPTPVLNPQIPFTPSETENTFFESSALLRHNPEIKFALLTGVTGLLGSLVFVLSVCLLLSKHQQTRYNTNPPSSPGVLIPKEMNANGKVKESDRVNFITL